MSVATTGPADAVGSQRGWLDRYSAVMMNTFGTPSRVFVRGEGTQLWDADADALHAYVATLDETLAAGRLAAGAVVPQLARAADKGKK